MNAISARSSSTRSYWPTPTERAAHFGAHDTMTRVVGRRTAGAGGDVARKWGEESQVARPVRRGLVERAHAVGVVRRERADPRRLPVGQEYVARIERRCAHGCQDRRSPPLRPEANVTGARR